MGRKGSGKSGGGGYSGKRSSFSKSGMYTSSGKPVYNPAAYAAARFWSRRGAERGGKVREVRKDDASPGACKTVTSAPRECREYSPEHSNVSEPSKAAQRTNIRRYIE